MTYWKISKTFLIGTNLISSRISKKVYPVYTFTGIPLHFPFRLLCTFLNTWNTNIVATHRHMYMKERDSLKHLVIILETVVSCVIYVFQFLCWSSYYSIYVAAWFPSYYDLNIDFIGLCSVLMYFERIYEYTSNFSLNHSFLVHRTVFIPHKWINLKSISSLFY